VLKNNKLKFNNDFEIKIKQETNYNIENADTLCPVCKHKNKRFWLTFYCGETLLVCRDCGYYKEI